MFPCSNSAIHKGSFPPTEGGGGDYKQVAAENGLVGLNKTQG